MSKTDKSKPWFVVVREHPLEQHDHRDGICDLPASPTVDAGYRGIGHCWWDATSITYFTNHCGCQQCTYQFERRLERRRDRHRARAACHRYLED